MRRTDHALFAPNRLGREPPGVHPQAIDRNLDRLVAAWSSAFSRTRARDCKLRSEHRNLWHCAICSPEIESSSTRCRPQRGQSYPGPQRICTNSTDFSSIPQNECGRVGGFRGKWITSSRRENCRLSASISTWSSGKTSAGDSCASLKKLMAAATALSSQVPELMTLRRQLLKF